MALPKDKVKPAVNYTHPSERDYRDHSKSAIGALAMTDPAKSGADYGIKDPQVTEAIAGNKSETGNGAGA